MDEAFLVDWSKVITAPSSVAGPSATLKRAGIPVVNFCVTGAKSRPIDEYQGPVIPRSVWNAVPPGNTIASDVCTCVCVPTTAVTRPSR